MPNAPPLGPSVTRQDGEQNFRHRHRVGSAPPHPQGLILWHYGVRKKYEHLCIKGSGLRGAADRGVRGEDGGARSDPGEPLCKRPRV